MVGFGKCLTAAVVVMLGTVPEVSAQEIATSFDQLRVLLKAGDTVTVTDATGRETRGKVRSLSSSSLELSVGDMPRLFGEPEVRSISQRRHASLGTGAKWGFFVGAGLAALVGIGAAVEGYGGGEVAAWTAFGAAVYGGLGAGIGVGVAALIRGPHVIYASRGASATRLTVSPVLLPGRKGAAVSVAF